MHKVDCGVIIETHIKKALAKAIYKSVFSNYLLETNYAEHAGGRLWVLWNPITVDVQVLDRGDQFIHCSLLHHATQRKIVVTFVYALNRAVERLGLWNRLKHISNGQLPWLCLGDFNVSLEADEKIGCQVASPKLAKLDRLLVNPIWFSHVPASTVVFLPAGASDHAPIVLTIPGQRTPPRSFKYLNCWALSPDFGSIIAAQWSPGIHGTKTFALFSTLRRLRDSLKKLNHSDFAGITKRVTEAKASFTQCQFLLQSSPLNQLLLAKEKEIASKYIRLKKAKMHFLAQKAKVQHLQLSDTNTRYFYATISARQRRNTIGAIADVIGRLCHGHDQVAEAFVGYYKMLLGSEEQVQSLPADLFTHNTLQSVSHLDNSVTIPEIKAALHSIDRNKSPGMDGYSSGFFVDTWETTGQDFCDAILEFFATGKMPRAANSTLVALIPKKNSPQSVTEFRPISYCTVYYKTASKILANRMREVLGHHWNGTGCFHRREGSI
ncbi:uncharacterized protein LOC141641166 [Silene latifolia]|uniref:uncharacterized protein LOC141641166 n=1 Tax=Silene latifolia TaxID=37657 RepID=UPI003D76EF54